MIHIMVRFRVKVIVLNSCKNYLLLFIICYDFQLIDAE